MHILHKSLKCIHTLEVRVKKDIFKYKDIIDRNSSAHYLSSFKIKTWQKKKKKIRSERDMNPWPRDTGVVLYQLSYQAN